MSCACITKLNMLRLFSVLFYITKNNKYRGNTAPVWQWWLRYAFSTKHIIYHTKHLWRETFNVTKSSFHSVWWHQWYQHKTTKKPAYTIGLPCICIIHRHGLYSVVYGSTGNCTSLVHSANPFFGKVTNVRCNLQIVPRLSRLPHYTF